MTRLEFVYFDLGNVLVKFAPERACQNLAAIANCEPSAVHQAVYESNLQWQYEAGKLSSEQFTLEVNRRLGTALPQSQLLRALADMFWWDTGLFPVISRLIGAGIPTGLLSNTCEAHWQHLLETGPALLRSLQPQILSYEVGCIKPDREIYDRAAAAAGVPGGRIAFTDDRPENVAGAEAAGWTCHLYSTPRDLVRWLSNHGLTVFV